ncbi:Aldo/keto reductase [Meredithblackwellia eburnea MCA 4105]
MASVNQKTATLNDGRRIPVIGLGTFLSKPNEVTFAVESAYDVGYRHFDLATCYQNEHEVGAALAAIAKKNPAFKRSDVWLTGKAWNSYHRKERMEVGLDQTLKDLGTDYLDLYLVHWPVHFEAVQQSESSPYLELTPTTPNPENPKIPEVALDKSLSCVEVWKNIIELQKSGKVKSIGVSNFSVRLLKKLIEETGVTPAVNQVEAHPYLLQQDLVDFCAENKIHISAYAPFGGDTQGGASRVLDDEEVVAIAKELGKDRGQVLASYGIKRGYSVLPKSVTASRIKSNFEVFELGDAEYERLVTLGKTKPHRYNLPVNFEPKWNVVVFDEPEEEIARGSHVVF